MSACNQDGCKREGATEKYPLCEYHRGQLSAYLDALVMAVEGLE